jgi:hypothetical protein
MQVCSHTFLSFSFLIFFSLGSAFQLEVDATSSFSYEKSTNIATITLNPIEFVIAGVPVYLEISAPIDLGYSIAASTTATVSSLAYASGSIEYGVEYVGGQQNLINSHNYKHGGNLNYISG